LQAICLAGFRVPAGKPASQSADLNAARFSRWLLPGNLNLPYEPGGIRNKPAMLVLVIMPRTTPAMCHLGCENLTEKQSVKCGRILKQNWL
jgi:hypothetical protein